MKLKQIDIKTGNETYRTLSTQVYASSVSNRIRLTLTDKRETQVLSTLSCVIHSEITRLNKGYELILKFKEGTDVYVHDFKI